MWVWVSFGDVDEVGMRLSRKQVLFSMVPAVLALVLFYSLAIHMHWSLGRWPSGIGELGFPPALLVHANLATTYFWFTLLLSVFVLPVFFVVCVYVSHLRPLVPCLILYAVTFGVCMGLMKLAPAPFRLWWMD